MDESADETSVLRSAEFDLNQVLGLFDVPAFARRGHDLEYALKRLQQRLERERLAMLDMVKLRLKQWASVSTGMDGGGDVWTSSLGPLYVLFHIEGYSWAAKAAPLHRRRAVGRDLLASVERFNRRWGHFLDVLALDKLNKQIERYNQYYVLEKECIVGSSRLASRCFVPKPRLDREVLLGEHPLLPVPELIK